MAYERSSANHDMACSPWRCVGFSSARFPSHSVTLQVSWSHLAHEYILRSSTSVSLLFLGLSTAAASKREIGTLWAAAARRLRYQPLGAMISRLEPTFQECAGDPLYTALRPRGPVADTTERTCRS